VPYLLSRGSPSQTIEIGGSGPATATREVAVHLTLVRTAAEVGTATGYDGGRESHLSTGLHAAYSHPNRPGADQSRARIKE